MAQENTASGGVHLQTVGNRSSERRVLRNVRLPRPKVKKEVRSETNTFDFDVVIGEKVLYHLSLIDTWEPTASRPETGLLIPSVINSYDL